MYFLTSYIYIWLVLFCINADFCVQIRIFQHFSRSNEIYKACILLHRSNLSNLAKFRQTFDDLEDSHTSKKVILRQYFILVQRLDSLYSSQVCNLPVARQQLPSSSGLHGRGAPLSEVQVAPLPHADALSAQPLPSVFVLQLLDGYGDHPRLHRGSAHTHIS